MRRVVCAAIRQSDAVICAPRHNHCNLILSTLIRNNGASVSADGWEQGFVDQYNTFMNRKEALQVASACNQLIRKTHPADRLFSEDIY